MGNKFTKCILYGTSIAVVAGFTFFILSPPSWAAGGGTTTLCTSGATRNTGSDKIGAGEKIKTGSRPLFLSFSSSAASGTVNFSSSSVEVDLIKNPRPACTFSKFLVNLQADCSIDLTSSHQVQAKFNCTDAGQDTYSLDDPTDSAAITPPNQNSNLYTATRQVLGLNDPSFNLAACDSVGTTEEQLACASAVCNMIKNQMTNGDTKALSTAGDIGQLVGSMQTTLDRCFAGSSLVQFQGAGASCSPDEVAASTGLFVLLNAPEEHVQVDSDGAGSYLISILAGSALFPGDSVGINMDTCDATITIP